MSDWIVFGITVFIKTGIMWFWLALSTSHSLILQRDSAWHLLLLLMWQHYCDNFGFLGSHVLQLSFAPGCLAALHYLHSQKTSLKLPLLKLIKCVSTCSLNQRTYESDNSNNWVYSWVTWLVVVSDSMWPDWVTTVCCRSAAILMHIFFLYLILIDYS